MARRAGPAEHPWRWCRRNPRATALLAAMALLALIASVGFVVALNFVWNTEDGQESLVGDSGPIALWAFSPDRHRLAMMDASRGSPVFADGVSGQIRRAVGLGHRGGIAVLEFSADGQTLATAGDDRAIKLWDVDTLEEALTVQGTRSNALALSFSPDQRTLASLDRDNTLMLWDLPAGESPFMLGPSGGLRDVRFSPDGSALATVGTTINQRMVVYLRPAPRVD